MSLEYCTGCGDHILTESELYFVFPHCTGYHLFCVSCGKVKNYNTLLEDIKTKNKELENIIKHKNLIGVCPACEQDRPDAVGESLFVPNSICPNCGHIEPDNREEVQLC